MRRLGLARISAAKTKTLDRLAVRVDVAYLRADVRVEAEQLELWPLEHSAHSGLRGTARDVQAELGVLCPGQEVRVRVGIDTGADAQENRGTRLSFRGDAREERDLVEVINTMRPTPSALAASSSSSLLLLP